MLEMDNGGLSRYISGEIGIGVLNKLWAGNSR